MKTGQRNIELMLIRDGVSEQADVYWVIRSDNPLFTDGDVSHSTGVVTFPKGLTLSFQLYICNYYGYGDFVPG